MNIAITTYIDNEKLLFEKHIGNYTSSEKEHIIKYVDKNKKNFKIVIDKNKDNVSIVKDNNVLSIKKEKSFSKYETNFGFIDLETKLVKIEKLERNNFIQFEIEYKIYFSKKDSQLNKLKILIKII